MAGLRCADLQSRPTEFLDFTSVTLDVDEFQPLVPPFEAAFHAHMAAWRLDGQPRTARRFTVYQTCPLPTPEDRLLFILAYVKTYMLQVVQGHLFGTGQSKANQWMHVLLPVLLAALRTLGDAPARSLTALAQQLGVSEADAATVVAPLAEEPAPVVAVPATASASPLVPMTGPNGVSSASTTLLNRPHVRAARQRPHRSDTSGGRVHEKPSADATPSPLPAGSRLLQDLGFLAFTLPQVEILMPTKKPRGQALTLEQQLANQALHSRRLRIEHVNRSVKRCRVVKDRIRLWKVGVRDLVMDICCALQNFRVRLSPWQPMI